MTEEILDIIDKKNEVIDQQPRDVAHALGLLHRGVSCLVFKDASLQEVLIEKRSQNKDSNPGKKSLVGGHLAAGEDFEEGNKRELQEEIFYGRQLPKEISPQKLFSFIKNADNDYELKAIYIVVYPGPFTPDPEEVENVRFEKLEKIYRDIDDHPEQYTETFIVTMREYKKYLDTPRKQNDQEGY
jgi:isopentenyl-diphosphate delta-isomerase